MLSATLAAALRSWLPRSRSCFSICTSTGRSCFSTSIITSYTLSIAFASCPHASRKGRTPAPPRAGRVKDAKHRCEAAAPERSEGVLEAAEHGGTIVKAEREPRPFGVSVSVSVSVGGSGSGSGRLRTRTRTRVSGPRI
jgi:hypothetical protein